MPIYFYLEPEINEDPVLKGTETVHLLLLQDRSILIIVFINPGIRNWLAGLKKKLVTLKDTR